MRKYLLGIMLLLCGAAVLLSAALPKSWRQIATDAIMAGDRSKAIKYYQMWTDADPGDAVSLYNLACCYSLDNQLGKAMSALEKAADAGWSDSVHTADDPDLAPLHAKPEFKPLLRRIAHTAASRSGGFIVNTCKQERVGRYLVVLPDEYDGATRYPLVVLLHGYGQSAVQFASVASMIGTHEFLYVVPEGPYTALDSEGKGFSHLREKDDYSEDTASVSSTAAWVLNVAHDAMQKYPVEGNRFWVVGFSQGGAMAHVIAARYPADVAGYCTHGGYIIKGQITPQQLDAEQQQGVHVLLTHGKDDPAVPFLEGVYAANMLRQSGIDVKLVALDVPHSFEPEVGLAVHDWLKEQLAPATPPR